MKKPHLGYEKKLWQKDFLVIGIDEVGRGAFAGPLVLGGVIFDPRYDPKQLLNFGINDSKKLTAKKREKLSQIIKEISLAHALSSVPVSIINKKGIAKATGIGVRDVIRQLQLKLVGRKTFLLIDAFYIKYIKGIGLANQRAIVHGDEISLSIAAASIIAKVARDNYMKKLARKYPQYGFDSHVGYGTAAHQNAILKFGETKIHRTDYISKVLSKNLYEYSSR